MFKPDSFILRKTATAIALIVQVFAVYLFFRGHNLPGGGFIAGVASAIGILLLIIANGKAMIPRLCPFDPLRLCAWGLMTAFLSGLPGLAARQAYLAHFHYKADDFPLIGSLYLGTPLLFDFGVYLTVVGVILKTTFVLLDALDAQRQAGEAAFHLPASTRQELLEQASVARETPSPQ